MRRLVKFELLVAAISFALIFIAGAAGRLAVYAGMDTGTADLMAKSAMLLLFCIFGFMCIGLLLHVFIVLQTGIGNASAPMVRFLSSHEAGLTFAMWGFLGIGTLVALPFA